MPASLIVINDIAAYFFGFFFGRTPLIKLSPKKTWEGFIGASVTTILSAFLVSKPYKLDLLCKFVHKTYQRRKHLSERNISKIENIFIQDFNYKLECCITLIRLIYLIVVNFPIEYFK